MNPLPAIILGGPPHAGKSVLFYALTHVLRERGIRHHAIRACPDGEGNWSQEADEHTVSTIRRPLKGEWPSEFVIRISQDLEHRCLPFLVDLGGCPMESDAPIFRQCTHSILLLRTDKEEAMANWRRVVSHYNYVSIAEIFSHLEGDSIITSQSPMLEGTISGLQRYDRRTATGSVFDALVDRVVDLFNSYSLQENIYFEQAPTSSILNLYESLRTFTLTSIWWKPDMLVPLLESLPQHTPLSVYGSGPNWLYAALAAHTDQLPFYQFDPRHQFGWAQPSRLQLSTTSFPELLVEAHLHQDVTVLSIEFPFHHLDYFQPEPLPFPPVPTDRGLIIDGPLPLWLVTALVRLYKESGVPWIAPNNISEKKAIVAYSHVETHPLGAGIPFPVH